MTPTTIRRSFASGDLWLRYFLKGLVSVAKHCVDVVYTKNDLKTLPNFSLYAHDLSAPISHRCATSFWTVGETYQGDADVAVNAGFLNDGNLSGREARCLLCVVPEYRDAMRRYPDTNRSGLLAAKDTKRWQPGVHLGEQDSGFR